ncbi:hypothetical protein [Natrinema salifodinae]|uniref:MJ0042 family finger-like domain-containing protein n=1 Tax=Natrinema salifodinae TaxID=1202768 RepID=A0A1I0MI87_9EURY|nr:hypothetical protein [Natrinema salifodinae]SEV88009.1 hypothetical protein SAMN05216285_0999 [Natrinema salifodinae]
MTTVQCPECLADAGIEIERNILESGLQKTFECENCGHIWNVVF